MRAARHPRMRSRWPAALFATSLLAGCATTPPSEPDDICAIFTEKRDWYEASRSAEEKWGTSKLIPMAFIHQESSFEHDARPPRRWLLGVIPWKRPSSAFGYAQALDGTWDDYQRDTGEHWRDRDDFEDALDFVHWKINRTVRVNGVARDDVYALYLNYHEGLGGYARGTHTGKPWLLRVARRVEQRVQRYQAQYAGCRESLEDRGLLRRLFGL